MRLQGKAQQRTTPKTVGQQGNRQETAPEAPLQSLDAEKTSHGGGGKAALPSAGSKQGRVSAPLQPQEWPLVSLRGRHLWLENLAGTGTFALPITPSIYTQKHQAVSVTDEG